MSNQNIIAINLELIDQPSIPIRTHINQDAIVELANDIALNGLMQPITVNPIGERYEIVAGHRRFLAHVHLHRPTIDCIVRQYTESEMLNRRFAENSQRSDASPIDEAVYLAKIRAKQNLSMRDLAKLVGRGLTYIQQRLAIVDYPEILFNALAEDRIPFSIARELYRLKDSDALPSVLATAINHGFNTTVARDYVRRVINRRKAAVTDSELAEVDQEISDAPEVVMQDQCPVCRRIGNAADMITMRVCVDCYNVATADDVE
jgi:ParB family chromosome partitioning protein